MTYFRYATAGTLTTRILVLVCRLGEFRHSRKGVCDACEQNVGNVLGFRSLQSSKGTHNIWMKGNSSEKR